MQPNLSQALHLINGETVERKIVAGGLVQGMIAAKKDDADDFECAL